MSFLHRYFARFSTWLRKEPAYQPIFWTLESVHLARAYYVVAELGIADQLRDGPRSCEELAEVTGTHSPSLLRVLRSLAAFGVFRCDPQGRYHLTRRAWPLLEGVPGSVRDWVRFTGRGDTWRAYQHTLDAVRTGHSGFALAHDQPLYEYCSRHPELDEVFISGMSGWTDWQSREIVDAYDFGSFAKIVDVGGGRGSLLLEILRRHPNTRSVLYDRPESIQAAQARFEEAGLADRCELVPGSFLEGVPVGGDAYVIKHVLRDWDDDGVLRILNHCHQAMPESGTLLIIDAALDPRNGKDRLLKLIDLEQMSLLTGLIRTRDEFHDLLKRSGFRLRKTTRTSVIDASVLEAHKD